MLAELRILLPYLGRYRLLYSVGAICLVAQVGLKLLIPSFLGESIDALGTSEPAPFGPAAPAARIASTALLIVLLAATVAAVRTLSRVLVLGTSRRVSRDLRGRVFDHLLQLAPSFFVRNPAGQIMSRCVNDMQNVQGLMGPVIMYLAETLLLLAIGIVMMSRIDPGLTAIGILPFPFFLVAARRLAVRIQEGGRAAQNSLGRMASKVDESLSGQLVIKSLALEETDRARFLERCREYRGLNLAITRNRALLIPMMMGLASLSTVIVLAVGGPRVARGEMSLGDLLAMVLYLQMLAAPTRTLGFVISSMRRGAAALGRIREILASEITLLDGPLPAPVAGAAGEISVCELEVVFPPLAQQPHLEGSRPARIEAAGPDEAHLPEARAGSDGSRRVLDAVSFTAGAGTTVGIVGHTGAGKTMLVRALARQLEIDPGSIFIDGVDVTEMQLGELRSQIGFVPQDAFLFSATLAENVALGRPEAGREEIEAAVRAAQLDRDLAQLPLGLETLVGERGVKLSGGQRQRTALARVLLLSPRILILDDALSAVDTETAEAILAHLRQFASGRTTFIVAHRLATIRHAQKILVLEEGRIAEEGDHETLLARDGLYARLWKKQAVKEERATTERTLEDELDSWAGGAE